MPTGYTYNIKDGIDFKTFVLQCARAFGALIDMRDDPSDAEIPDEFKPSDYHSKGLKESKDKEKKLKSLSKEQIKTETIKYNDEIKTNYNKRIQELYDLKDKYSTMLNQVDEWIPPTNDHHGLKSFMREQLTTSISHDCYVPDIPKFLSPEEWFNNELRSVKWNIDYHIKELKKEKGRCEENTKWVKELKNSLKI